jgi:hypothetical protein
MQMKTVIHAAVLGVAFAAAPLAVSPGEGVTANNACAQVKTPSTGTCCPQNFSVCITPSGNLYNYYYKSEGPC